MEKVADIYLHFQLLYTPVASLGKSALQDMYKSHHPNSFSKFQGILLKDFGPAHHLLSLAIL